MLKSKKVWIAVLAVLLLGSCIGILSGSPDAEVVADTPTATVTQEPTAIATVEPTATATVEPTATPTLGKYTQTWTTPYDETTCAQWVNEMDNHQHFVMAGDMLYAARKSDGGDVLPSDQLIEQFALAIYPGVCDSEDLGEFKVVEIAASLYVLDEQFKP